MDTYLDFISNHSMLFIAFVIVLILLMQTYFQGLTRKFSMLNTAEATTLINRQEPVVIDVRSENEFKEGHIANAIHIPLADLKDNADKLTKHAGKPLLLYCKSGPRSDEACKILSKQGLTDLHCLNGGVLSWQEENMPLTKD